ncbi:Gfo/Idh/MocA family protein [Gilvimarinus sp. DA14]|uniref:Gfo/Idh/MocA family protein n=1 Tax=Gilvimarinus sp. DA14 TaxID=2956798 RepID=UPI0020B731FB|nr:Gfo/Idh/MocA family oxidoreductase [Gilvimarinus sp. DA14]UTF60076.1 Gfo/Idh/MocA family oxidoreductase [Gilvimarinus sp. DA14]
MTDQTIRWGILGAGVIAHKMADAINLASDNQLLAVASRTPSKADAFAAEYDITAETYESLLTRDDIDVVYIATTHNFHADNALLALEHGKNLVIEKPFTVNAAEAQAIVDKARATKCFVMEAIWTRFLPSMLSLKEHISEGAIGQVKAAHVTFGGIAPDHYRGRLYDPAVAGGVTLDMGIYPVSMLCAALGKLPEVVSAQCVFTDTGVDEITSFQLRFPGPILATVNTSFNLMLGQEMTLYGDAGTLSYENFQGQSEYTLKQIEGREYAHTGTVGAENAENGFVHQVEEAARCLRKGLGESPIIPLEESVAIMKVLDQIRAKLPLRYDFE